MTRLRFIADGARGPHGGHNDGRTLFSSPDTAKRDVGRRKAAGRVLVVDLDELEVHGASVDERWQFAERQMLRWAQIAQELKPEAALAEAPAPERVLLTAADVRHLALVANTWLRADGKTTAAFQAKKKAEADLRTAFYDLFTAGKLPVGVLESMFYGPLDGATRS